VVIAAVSACVLILVAAGIVRVVHASSEPARAARPSSTANANTVATQAPSPASTIGAGGAPAAAGSPGSSVASSDGLNAPTAGTLHLERNLTPRWVWIDGKKLSSRNEVVACGPHTLKVGHGHPRPIDVPCGGEMRVSR
jgi:hypothetical protein